MTIDNDERDIDPDNPDKWKLIDTVVVRPSATSFHVVFGVNPDSDDPVEQAKSDAIFTALEEIDRKDKERRRDQAEINAYGLSNPTPIRCIP